MLTLLLALCCGGTAALPPVSSPLPRRLALAGCEAGSYTRPGAVSAAVDACQPCESGKFQDETGQTRCKDCPVGMHQDQVGATVCSACAAGQVQASTAQALCTRCAPGRFQHDSGQTRCLRCPSGAYTRPGGGASTCAAPSLTSVTCSRTNVAMIGGTVENCTLDGVFAAATPVNLRARWVPAAAAGEAADEQTCNSNRMAEEWADVDASTGFVTAGPKAFDGCKGSKGSYVRLRRKGKPKGPGEKGGYPD